MQQELAKIKQEVAEAFEKIKSEDDLRALKIRYLGRKGKVTKLLRGLVDLEEAEKKNIGQEVNEYKKELTAKFKILEEKLSGHERHEFIDPTLPGKKLNLGHLHPVTLIQNELEDLFLSLGFMVLDGPELESEYYNFTALNIPAYHPARDIQDTFYVNDRLEEKSASKNAEEKFGLVMRTHTSPMQVRAMEKYGAPLKCVVPGRVFRSEAIDSSHEHTFYQMEGLMIDENISIDHLIAVTKELINGIFKKEMTIRIRPGYFPFVEPAIEMDIKCTICGGSGCLSCKKSGWVELMPGGMVHPNVLRAGGINPDVYSGFAFGLGLTRMAMMKYGIDDIRLFNSGDLRFLEQF